MGPFDFGNAGKQYWPQYCPNIGSATQRQYWPILLTNIGPILVKNCHDIG